jgi:hypothetical protein
LQDDDADTATSVTSAVMEPEGRRALHAYLTPKAYQGWVDTADDLGVSVSGLLEAFGRDLAENPPGAKGGKGHPRWHDLSALARRIDAERRRRRIPRPN